MWPEARETGGFDPAFTPLLLLLGLRSARRLRRPGAVYGVLARMAYAYLRLYEGDLGVQIAYAAALWFLVVAVRQDPVSVVVEGTVCAPPDRGHLSARGAEEAGVGSRTRRRLKTRPRS